MTPEQIALLRADERAWDELYSPFDLKVRTLVTRLVEERQRWKDAKDDKPGSALWWANKAEAAEQRIAELEESLEQIGKSYGVISGKLSVAERQLAEFRTHLKWWVGTFGDVQVAEHEEFQQKSKDLLATPQASAPQEVKP